MLERPKRRRPVRAMLAGLLVLVGANAIARRLRPTPTRSGPRAKLETSDVGWLHFGLLRSRDLTPFGFLLLDMRPAHAYVSRAGRWAFALDLGYQNTWAVGGAADPYLESLGGRRELSPTDWNAIKVGGEAFLVDLELAQLDATVSYWITDRLSVYLIASGVRYQGGFLDSTIESFHRRTGLGDFQRDTSKRDDLNVLVNLRGGQAEYYSAPVRDGLLDPAIGLRYTLERVPDPWNVIVELAAKVPLEGGGPRPFLSTGVVDWGSQVTAGYTRGRNAFYLSGAVLRAGGTRPVESSRRWMPSAVAGYERGLTRNASLIVQGLAAPTRATTPTCWNCCATNIRCLSACACARHARSGRWRSPRTSTTSTTRRMSACSSASR